MSLDSTEVSSIMIPNVIVDTEDDRINGACKIMDDNKIGCVIIVSAEDREKPIGIFTESDVVRTIGKINIWLSKKPVEDLIPTLSNVMSKPVTTILQTSSVKSAMQIMSDKNIRRLVVVDKNQKMVGIITIKDILKFVNGSAELIADFYGPSFPVKSAEMFERFTEYKFDNSTPQL